MRLKQRGRSFNLQRYFLAPHVSTRTLIESCELKGPMLESFSMTPQNPVARKQALLCEVVGEETVVFDRNSKKAYRLNRSASMVWRNCDGNTSIDAIAGILKSELQIGQSAEDLVVVALQRLEALGLLAEPSGVTRRDAGRKLAVAAGLIPLVAALSVPTPAKASSSAPPAPAPAPWSPPSF
jgi:Coenzyme PQQ synthesis protein D (PqqD)